MAGNSRTIKRRISSAKNIAKITKAMEMVSASKMRRAQAQALKNRDYARAIAHSLHTVAQHSESSLHPLLQENQSGERVLVLISTDKGLCGGLNTTLFRQVLNYAADQSDFSVVVVGKKAAHFADRLGMKVEARFTELPEQLLPADTLPLATLLMEGYLSGRYRVVDILYMDFINTISQEQRFETLLPVSGRIEESSQDLSGARTEAVPQPIEETKEYIFEPNAKAILNSLLPYYVENTVYQIFLEAKASEHSARMVAMKNASENAGELMDELQLLFNKSRQAAITAELQEITTASLSLQ